MTESFSSIGPVDATPDAELRDLARKRLESKQGFRGHVVIYLLVNALLWAIYVAVGVSSGAWFPWPIFPSLGWGVGLAAHAWSVYGERPITEAEVDAEVRRLGRRT